MTKYNKLTFTTALVAASLAGSSLFATTLNMMNGGDVTSLDPHKISGDWENRVAGDIFEGLVTEDIMAEPIPGMAESWDVSEDGLTYTFHLRDDIKWSDGEPVTAGDFEFSFKRLMDPNNAADYAYLQYYIKNAEAINNGEMEVDTLGVTAIDDKTLEIQLENPTPYILDALTHYTAYPVPKHILEEHGDDWVDIEKIATNGPYTPTEWVPGSHIASTKNEMHYAVDDLQIDDVNYAVLEDNSAALKAYRAGEFDWITAFPADQYQWMQENLPDQARVKPFLGVYYYALNHEDFEPFNDVRVREALSIAVNRKIIGEKVLGTGQPPAYGWVPPGTDNYDPEGYMPEYADMEYGARVERAKELLAEAGYGPDNPLEVQLRYNTDENHKRVAIAIAAMWKPLGVEVELYNTEVKVHYDELTKGVLEVARAGWLMDYNDPINMLELLKTGVPYNYGRYSNEEYDALLNQSATMLDLDERAEVLLEAETMAMDDFAAIPIYYYASENVVSPDISGFEDNVKDVHRTRWMSKSE